MKTCNKEEWLRKANNLSVFLFWSIIDIGVLFVDAYIVTKYLL